MTEEKNPNTGATEEQHKAFHAKISAIQCAMAVKKDRKGNGYAYRNIDDILDAVKPHLKESGLVINLTDELIEIAGEVYCKSRAWISDGVMQQYSDGYARANAPQLSKTGREMMSRMQLNGAASSYARRYALCGLLAVSDGTDTIEELDEHGYTVDTVRKNLYGRTKEKLTQWTKENGVSGEELGQFIMNNYDGRKLRDLSVDEMNALPGFIAENYFIEM